MEYNQNPESQFRGSFLNAKKEMTKLTDGNKYICPMNCELDRTYAVSGHCPECNQELVAENAE